MRADADQDVDVVVVGAGNAGLCAAIAARERGARVLVLEKAPRAERGGDTAFTGALYRFPFDDPSSVAALLPEYARDGMATVELAPYRKTDFLNDLDEVTEGLADAQLAQALVDDAYPTMRWLTEQGIQWVLALGRQAFKKDGRHRFFGNLILEAVGGGQGLSDQLFRRAESLGVEVSYESKASQLVVEHTGEVVGVVARVNGDVHTVGASAVVLACGGFQANSEMRARYLGPDWELAKVRGTRFNTGEGIRMALEIGAQPYGHWSSCHAVAWDLMAPAFGDLRIGDLYQKHSYPLGIVVNRDGRRFLDEGANFRNYTYAMYGRRILQQPGRRAFQIFDSKTTPLLRDEYRIREVTMARANTIGELADQLLVDRGGLERTVAEFNAAVAEGTFDPAHLDGKGAAPQGQPPKSNWAQRLDAPPFEGYAVTCGITFTFGGLKITSDGNVLDTEDRAIPGLFAAGEIIGGLFYYNYPGGSGLMAGSVFGRRAGASAAERRSRTAVAGGLAPR
ncbi:MAG TPA: FAD-dependent tricarballylate dehydrogenase TcuA [Candidatus Limnocylindria bacterium]|nr:FAD-dependent tricarballylate dehydrogenase TcuA [Candidatus Limnocylindria bacterium]